MLEKLLKGVLNVLKIENLYKTFSNNQSEEKVILNKLNLTAQKGDFITIIGGNGAGKSTLMNLISGTIFSDSGKIYIDEKNVTYMPEHKRAKFIGRVFQNPLNGTAPNLTIEENLFLAVFKKSLKNLKFGINKKTKEFFKEKLLSLNSGLEDRLKTKVGLLSGGQRQALTLLMATIVPPKILLLDEHTAALDPKSSYNILELTQKIAKNSEMITLMITHNMEIATTLGNRIILLNSGKVELDIKGENRKSINFTA